MKKGINSVFIAFLWTAASPYVFSADWESTVNNNDTCIISELSGEVGVVMSHYPSSHFELALASQNWKSLIHDREYTIDIEFDQKGAWEMPMTAEASGDLKVLKGYFDDNKGVDFFKEFTLSDSMYAGYKGKTLVTKSLAGSMKAYYRMMECVNGQDPLNSTRSGRPNSRDPFL